ncbi:hypothetical protein [Hymenobacter antarcticus]|uniref:Uncharacterized protein n=1 Tax=Hymenobacter antarcticus TaxID=486270 RepID=A0ABP7QDY4_9BACT
MSVGLKSVAAAVLIPTFGLLFGVRYWLSHSRPEAPLSRPVPVRPVPALTIPLARPDTLSSTSSPADTPARPDTLAQTGPDPATDSAAP